MKNRFIKLGAVLLALGGMMCSCGSSASSDGNFADVEMWPVRLGEVGPWSMITPDGKIKYENELDNEPSPVINGMFSMKKGSVYHLYKAKGDTPELIEGCDNLIDVGYMSEGLIPVCRPDSRISMLDKDGKEKFTLEPVDGHEIIKCSDRFSDGLMAIQLDNDLKGYMDTEGKVVVTPAFYEAYPFAEGLAVVMEQAEGSRDRQDFVIDKTGNKVISFGDEYKVNLNSRMFKCGMLNVYKKYDSALLDKEGKEVIVLGDHNKIIDYNDKYIIYENVRNECGLMNIKGETLVEAQYASLAFDGDDRFIAMVYAQNPHIVIINDSGDEVESLDDVKYMAPAGKFGYFAINGDRTINLVDGSGKAKNSEPLGDITNLDEAEPGVGEVVSNFYNIDFIINAITGLINENGVGAYTFGESADVVNKGSEASDGYSTSVGLKDVNIGSRAFRITGVAYFDKAMALTERKGGGAYGYNYVWNPESKINKFSIDFYTRNEVNESDVNKLVEAFKTKGFKVDEVIDSYEKTIKMSKDGRIVTILIRGKRGFLVNYALS